MSMTTEDAPTTNETGQCDACAREVPRHELRTGMPSAGVEGTFCAACRGDRPEPECTCHKFIRLHDGHCAVHGDVKKQTVFCLDCAGPAWDSCIRWHTTRKNGVAVKSEDKPSPSMSPLPWHGAAKDVTMIVAADRARVADCSVAIGMSQQEQEGNAAYIVKAANAYPVLLEAVKHALALEMSSGEQHKELHQGYVELLRGAIESAEGK